MKRWYIPLLIAAFFIGMLLPHNAAPPPMPIMPVPNYATAAPPPAAPTALCKDGTYSYAVHHQGACSQHRGVDVWYR